MTIEDRITKIYSISTGRDMQEDAKFNEELNSQLQDARKGDIWVDKQFELDKNLTLQEKIDSIW